VNPIANRNAPDAGFPVTNSCSRRQLRDLMEEDGCHVKQIQTEHIFPYRTQDYV